MDIKTRNGLYGFEYREPDLRRAKTEHRVHDIKQLWQRNHEIINLASLGYKGTDIADILGISPQTVSNTLNSTLGQYKLSDVRLERDKAVKKIHEKVRVLTNKALNVYHEIFDNAGELSLKDRGNFATTFLNEMSGLRAPTRIQKQTMHTTLTREEIEALKMRGAEKAKASGFVVSDRDEVSEETPQSEALEDLDK